MKKRILALILMFAIICTMLTSCEVVKLVNNIFGLFGIGDGDTTNNVSINFQIPDPTRCTSHVIEALESIAPTCSAPGYAGGQVCRVCGVVIVAQVELPALEHIYDNQEDSDCNICEYIREIRCEHLLTKVLSAKSASCTSTGRTEGEQCIGCGKIIAGYEMIQPTPHIYDNDQDNQCNDCNYIRKLECTHEATQKLASKSPSCTETGLTEGVSCVHCGEILLAQQTIGVIDHAESDWIVDKAPTDIEKGQKHTECTACGITVRTGEINTIAPEVDENASQGLTFVMNEDRNSYILIDIGTCTDTEIVIPSYYNGKPVTKINDGAFLNQYSIKSVVISEGILNIGNGAFRNCKNLTSVTIPESVTSIGEYAFYDCDYLSSITLPSGLKTIEKYTFYNCDLGDDSNNQFVIPYGVVSIGEYAFSHAQGEYRIKLILPASLEIIGKGAFEGWYGSVTIPNGVKSIGSYAFSDYSQATLFKGVEKIGGFAFADDCYINFKGTKADWYNIIIDPRNFGYRVTCTDAQFDY